jgi:hypothetical protein
MMAIFGALAIDVMSDQSWIARTWAIETEDARLEAMNKGLRAVRKLFTSLSAAD